MALRIGDTAPDFEQDSTVGKIKFHEYLGNSWGVLFSHPADYTPVCTTELGEVSKRLADFQKRNVKPVALSVDAVDKHKGWVADINETQHTTVTYPIIADHDRHVSKLYGMLDQTNLDDKSLPMTVRAVFIIDPSKKVRLIIVYPASCGRNFNELFRVIDSLQLTTSKGGALATPANWEVGQDVIVAPTVNDAKAKELFGDFKTIKPYLRTTKAPTAAH